MKTKKDLFQTIRKKLKDIWSNFEKQVRIAPYHFAIAYILLITIMFSIMWAKGLIFSDVTMSSKYPEIGIFFLITLSLGVAVYHIIFIKRNKTPY